MGSNLELNDTLLITTEQGFPSELLNRDAHVRKAVRLDEVADRIFSFCEKDGARIFHLDPVRVYLVENVDGKWIFWGKAFVLSQSIEKKLEEDGSWKLGNWVTSGTFKIVDLFEPDYQETFSRRECPPGKSFFK